MKHRDVINMSLEFIEVNLGSELNCRVIASHSGYSEYHFSRLFKSQMGMSVMEYVKKRKLIKASRDIINGQKIIDTAFCYGWLSHGGFTKAFKQEFGFSPALLKTMIVEMGQLGGNTMNHIFMKQTKEHLSKEQLFGILENSVGHLGRTVDIKRCKQVYDFACKAYFGMKRYSGDEYITHPLHVAILLEQMEADESVILAGLLCDVLDKTEISIEELQRNVPDEVVKIVAELKEFDPEQATVLENEEVIMVKLAERLHNMRTIEFIDDKKKMLKAKESIDLFMPVARKLGNAKLTQEINDLAIKYI